MISIALNLDGFRTPIAGATAFSLRKIIEKNQLPIDLVTGSDPASYALQTDTETWLRMILGNAEQILKRAQTDFSARPILLMQTTPGGPLGNDPDNPEVQSLMFTAFRHREGHEWLFFAPLGAGHHYRDLIEKAVVTMSKIRSERPETHPPPHMHSAVDLMTSLIGASMEYATGMSTIARH